MNETINQAPMPNVEILLVEDNDSDAILTVRALQKHKITNNLFRVKNGQEALDFLFAEGGYRERDPHNLPKVVILDIALPEISGLEVLRRLRADARTQLIPIVILSASQEESDMIESYRLGANSYIVKPVDFEKFSDAISNLGFYWLILNKRPVNI